MTVSLFDWQTWLVAAFALGVIELMLGTVLLGGMAFGALGTAIAVALFGTQMAEAIGPDWALPLAVWAILSLLGTMLVKAMVGRVSRQSEDVNEKPYKGDDD